MKRYLLAAFIAIGLLAPCIPALAADEPLTNADIVRLVHGGIADQVVAATVRSKPGNYDVSPDALVALKKAGVGDVTMRTMVEAGHIPSLFGIHAPQMLSAKVAALGSSGRRELAVNATRVAQTQTAGGFGAGMSSAMMLQGLATTAISMIPGVGMVASVVSMFHHAKPQMPEIHQVWALANQRSAMLVESAQPTFEVSYGGIPGLDADRFEPVLVHLVATKDNYRIVGATKSGLDAQHTSAMAMNMMGGGTGASVFPISDIVEERVPVRTESVAPATRRITPEKPLDAGEYAVVLRPVRSGGDSTTQTATGQGLSSVISSAWDFTITGAPKSD